MSDSNVDSASNLNSPQDLVLTNANGDWTATIKVREISSGSWYYGYLTFLAMDDYDNHVGFLMGDSSVDVKLEKGGIQTGIVANSSYNISTVPYYRIVKSATTIHSLFPQTVRSGRKSQKSRIPAFIT